MSGHSTRYRIKERMEHVQTKIGSIYDRFQQIDRLGADRSEWINDNLPHLVQGLKAFEEACETFYKGL